MPLLFFVDEKETCDHCLHYQVCGEDNGADTGCVAFSVGERAEGTWMHGNPHPIRKAVKKQIVEKIDAPIPWMGMVQSVTINAASHGLVVE